MRACHQRTTRFILGFLLATFLQIAPRCLAQDNSLPVPEPPVEPADCPKFTSFPQAPMSVVVSCTKDDSTEVILPLKPDDDGHSREKKVRGLYELRQYHLPKIYTQEMAFDSMMQLIPMAGYFIKYSARPSTITARGVDSWVLINVNSEYYTVAMVHSSLDSCAAITDANEIARRIQAQNRVAVYGITFTPQNQINQGASSDTLAAVLKYLRQNPNLNFTIESHKFSSNGTEIDDLETTRERANTVGDWLVTQGIPAARFQVKPFGRIQPVTDNETPSEIECNDRIELARTQK